MAQAPRPKRVKLMPLAKKLTQDMTVRDIYQIFAHCSPDYGERTVLLELDRGVHCYLLGLLKERLPRHIREMIS